MAEINPTNRHINIDYMARDYDSLLQSMRDLIPYKLPEWKTYESEADFGNVLLELFAHIGDILSYYQDRVANESFLATAQSRYSIIQHLKLIGYQLRTAAPASTQLLVTLPTASDTDIIIKKGNAFATKSQADQSAVHFEYTRNVPLTISKGQTRFEIPVEEGWLIEEEFLGTSDGTPNQKFTLAHSPIILRYLGPGQTTHKDIILRTEIGENQREEWTLQQTLAFSRTQQPDFIIEIDEDDQATVIFGDGNFGKIPPNGANIKVTYRVGGGAHGNVPANTIDTIADAPQLTLLAATITNPKPATGGAERESIEQAVLQAPSIFRSYERAVTAADYKALALNFPGVGKVRAVASDWRKVTLYVAPTAGGFVSDVLKTNLLAYFEDKRQISTVIEIEDVDYVNIYVTAKIGVKGYYLDDEVEAQVREKAGALLNFAQVDFGQTIYLSKFYEVIEAIEGIKYVTITQFNRNGQNNFVEPSGKLKLQPNEIPISPTENDKLYTGGIQVIVTING